MHVLVKYRGIVFNLSASLSVSLSQFWVCAFWVHIHKWKWLNLFSFIYLMIKNFRSATSRFHFHSPKKNCPKNGPLKMVDICCFLCFRGMLCSRHLYQCMWWEVFSPSCSNKQRAVHVQRQCFILEAGCFYSICPFCLSDCQQFMKSHIRESWIIE